jgi:hypothetical protein
MGRQVLRRHPLHSRETARRRAISALVAIRLTLAGKSLELAGA